MSKMIKKWIRNFGTILSIAAMFFSIVAPSIVGASIVTKNEISITQSQLLSNNEMKEIVGGKKILSLFCYKVSGNITKIPANTTRLEVKGTSYSCDAAVTWFIWDSKTHTGKYEVNYSGVSPIKVIYVEAKAYDSTERQIGKAYIGFVTNNSKNSYDLIFP